MIENFVFLIQQRGASNGGTYSDILCVTLDALKNKNYMENKFGYKPQSHNYAISVALANEVAKPLKSLSLVEFEFIFKGSNLGWLLEYTADKGNAKYPLFKKEIYLKYGTPVYKELPIEFEKVTKKTLIAGNVYMDNKRKLWYYLGNLNLTFFEHGSSSQLVANGHTYVSADLIERNKDSDIYTILVKYFCSKNSDYIKVQKTLKELYILHLLS